MVNHLWLEDCFSQWRILSLNDPRYTCFPPGLDLSSEIGRRGIKISHDAVELDLLAKESGTTATASTAENGTSAVGVVGNEDVGTLKKAGSLKKVVAASVLSDGTASAKEVEDVVEFEGTDGDDDIFMDVDPEPQVRKEKGKKVISGDEMDVDIDSGDNQRAKDSSSPKKNQKPKSSSKSLVPSPSKSKNKHLGTVLVTSSDEHDARAASNKPWSSESGAKTAAQGRSNAAELWRQDEVEVEHSQKRSNIKETRPVGRTAKRIQSEEEDSDAVFLIGPPVTPKKYTPKTPQNPRARNKSHSKSRPVDEDIDMDDIQVVSPIRKKSRARKSTPRAPSRSSPVRTRSQSRTRKPVAPPLSIDDTEDDNEHEEPPRQRTLQRAASKSNTENDDEAPRGRPLAKASSVKSAGRTPRRHSSQAYVSLPTNKEIKQRERERSRHGTPARPIGRKESTDVEDISPKRGRPPGRTLSRTQSKSKSKSKTRPVVEVETLSELSPSPSPSPVPQRFVKPKTPHRGVVAEAGPSKKVLDTPSTVGRTPSRRSAATKATQRLRDEIMPDVLSFQKQMKRGVVKGSWEEKERTNDKEKFKGKGKKRLSVEDDDDGGTSIVGETDDEREKKKRKIEVPSAKKGRKGKSKGKNEGEGGDDDVSMMDEGDSRRPQKATKKLGSSKLRYGDHLIISYVSLRKSHIFFQR